MDASSFRQVMGCWATGVSVITSQGRGVAAGVTANALSSLSLDPLLVLVCFDLGSRTLQAVRESERFCVNILARGQEDVSRRFATKREHHEKFAATPFRLEHGVPVIEGVHAWIACALDAELRRGDHVVVIGEVLGCDLDPDARPLVYYRGAYGELHAADVSAAPAL